MRVAVRVLIAWLSASALGGCASDDVAPAAPYRYAPSPRAYGSSSAALPPPGRRVLSAPVASVRPRRAST